MTAPNNPAKPSLAARLQEEQKAVAARQANPAAVLGAMQGEVQANASRGQPAETTLVNPQPPSPSSGPFAEHELATFEASLPDMDLSVLQVLNEALAGWRGVLIGLKTRKEGESTFNPGAYRGEIQVIQEGINKADQLLKVISDFMAG